MGMFFAQLRERSRDDMVRGARITMAKFASPCGMTALQTSQSKGH
jgi:hypothetical protein